MDDENKNQDNITVDENKEIKIQKDTVKKTISTDEERPVQEAVPAEEERPVQEAVPAEEEVCKFCLEGDENEKLITPCKCNGSVKYIHKSCLLKWFDTGKKKNCPICKYDIKYKENIINKTYKYFYDNRKLLTILVYILCFVICVFLPNIILYFFGLIGESFIFQLNSKIIFRTLKIFTYLMFLIITILGRYNENFINKIFLNFQNNNSNNMFNIFLIGYYMIYESINYLLESYFPLKKEIIIYEYNDNIINKNI